MNIFALIASFGGGAFAAGIGALPAFIMTGFIVIAGTAITLAGGGDVVTGNIAFGSFFGPHKLLLELWQQQLMQQEKIIH